MFILWSSTDAFAAVSCSDIQCNGPMAELASQVYIDSYGNVRLWMPAEAEVMNCSLSEGRYAVLHHDHPAYAVISSAIMMASASNKKFKIRIAEGSSDCEIDYIQYWNS